MKLSKITNMIKPSLTRELFSKAKEYEDVIDLTLGDPDFLTSPHVSDAGCAAIRSGKTKYSLNAGILELREAISQKINDDYGVNYDPQNEIIVTVGAMGALYLTMKCLIDVGDEVIIPAPYWINYVQQVVMCGGSPIIVDSYEEDNFNVKMENIEKAITKNTKAIILNSPNNPTGRVLSKDAMEDIARIAVKYDLTVIADESYKELVYDDREYVSILDFDDMKKRTIVINSFSKTYSMTGWRIGYAASSKDIIGKMTVLQENIYACAPTPSQYAALSALEGPSEHTEYMKEQFEKRRNALVEGINTIDTLSCRKPEGAFYAFVNIKKTGMDSIDFAYDLLDKKKIAVVPGIAYGDIGRDYVRMAYTVDIGTIQETVRRLREYAEANGRQREGYRWNI